MSYLAKTFLIIFLTLHTLTLLPLAIAYMRESDSVGERVFWVVYSLIVGSLYVKFTIDVIKSDDDDWFNKQGKRAKSWIKGRLRVRRLKPA